MPIDKYIASLRTKTASEYKTTAKYLSQWDLAKVPGQSFSDFLRQKELAQNTIAKHVGHARVLCRKCNLSYQIDVLPRESVDYPQFTDDDFQTLYAAFADADYPKFIEAGQRHRYWQTVIHFVAVTAVRRQAVLGIQVSDVDFTNLTVTVKPANDKRGKQRIKPITTELASDVTDLLRYYDKKLLPKDSFLHLFPWEHGDRCWYASKRGCTESNCS